MNLELYLHPNNSSEKNLVVPFCEALLSSIKQDVLKNLNEDRLRIFESRILSATWIDWLDNKPKSIDMNSLIRFILNNLIIVQRKPGIFVIRIKHILLPGTNTWLDTLVRFLDKGNQNLTNTKFISLVLDDYKVNINKYWKAFVYERTHRFPKSSASCN